MSQGFSLTPEPANDGDVCFKCHVPQPPGRNIMRIRSGEKIGTACRPCYNQLFHEIEESQSGEEWKTADD